MMQHLDIGHRSNVRRAACAFRTASQAQGKAVKSDFCTYARTDPLRFVPGRRSLIPSPKLFIAGGRRAAAKPSSLGAAAVNNFAESAVELVKNLPLANDGPVRKAPRPARSTLPNPSRVRARSPAGSRAAVQRSERTTSHEDFCIRSTSDGPPTSSYKKNQLKPREHLPLIRKSDDVLPTLWQTDQVSWISSSNRQAVWKRAFARWNARAKPYPCCRALR